MKHFIGGPTLWQRARRRTGLAIAILLAATGTVTLAGAPQSGAAAPPVSAGCDALNHPSFDGTYNQGVIGGYEFNRNDRINIKAPSNPGITDSIQLLVNGSIQDGDDTVSGDPATFEIDDLIRTSGEQNLTFRAVDSGNNLVPNVSWTVSCTPSPALYSNTCWVLNYSDFFNPARDVSSFSTGTSNMDPGEIVIATAKPSSGTLPSNRFVLGTSTGGPITNVGGPTTIPGQINYVFQAGVQSIAWGINPLFQGTPGSALLGVKCFKPAVASETRAHVISTSTVLFNGQVVYTGSTEAFGLPGVAPNLDSAESTARSNALGRGYDGPITCTRTPRPAQPNNPDRFRADGNVNAALTDAPTTDNFVSVFFNEWTVACTMTAIAPCGDDAPTPAGYTLIKGTSGNDTLTGGSGKTIIKGLGGNDRISDLSGDDILCGGPGNDNISGGGGNDVLLGGTGTDQLDGSSGTDTAYDPDANTRYSSIEKKLS